MSRPLLICALLFLCLVPGRLAGQQSYPRLARVVGAIRAAALVSAPVAPPRPPEPLDHGLSLPPLASPTPTTRRRVLRLNLSERLQFRATGDWAAPGPMATLGIGVRF